jgi:hypothetical protein
MIAAGILFVGGVAVVCACSCLPAATPKEALAQADAVFAGTVASIEDLRQSTADPNFTPIEKKVTFRVSQTWKGKSAADLVVRTASNSAECGYHFVVGSNYVVYANLPGGISGRATNLYTTICTRTREYSKAADDLRDLGAGQKPKAK